MSDLDDSWRPIQKLAEDRKLLMSFAATLWIEYSSPFSSYKMAQ